uniref:GPR158/179 extracellular domain-containing protein n=1 Tax=Timema douglasi TaxID=61478 RepID=A0A7R8VQD7_TIMDO|nr:unnamed protein product [Timema douglasi]
MRACCLLLLAALRTVAAGSSVASHEQATSSSLCEPASLLGFPPLSSDVLPTDLLALTHVANDTARVLAVWMAEDPLPDLDFTLAAQARTLVEAHPQLTAAVVALPRHRDASVVAYRKESRTHVVLLNSVGSWNHSSTLEVYWRNSETAWNKTMGLLSQPFWDCFTGAWVFGYNVPLPGEHRGAAGIYFSVDHLNIDQCNESYTSLFGAHICDPETAMCVPELGEGNRRGYTCACKPGFFARESRLHWRFFNVAQSSLYR